VTSGQATGADASCASCGSPLRANAPYCGACGQAVTNRQVQPPHPAASNPVVYQQVSPSNPPAAASDHIVPASREVRCCCYLLDLAAMMSPALPLAAAAVILGVAEVVYLVVPVAFVAVWIWMALWQGFTGMSFGKAMLGLRSVSAADHLAPGFWPTIVRGLIFAGTAGLAALPVVTSAIPGDGWHDHLSGITLIDITRGSNPLGPRQQTTLRKTIDRGLKQVQSPVPLGTAGRT
jgi:hypothetical protein